MVLHKKCFILFTVENERSALAKVMGRYRYNNFLKFGCFRKCIKQLIFMINLSDFTAAEMFLKSFRL